MAAFDRGELIDAFGSATRELVVGDRLRLLISAACFGLLLAFSFWIGRGVVRSISDSGNAPRVIEIGAVQSPAGYCNEREVRYLFFAEEPIFGVALYYGKRRQEMTAARLYAGVLRGQTPQSERRYCDCRAPIFRSCNRFQTYRRDSERIPQLVLMP